MNKRTLLITDEAEQFLIQGALKAMEGGMLSECLKDAPRPYEIELEMSLDSDVISTCVHLKQKEAQP